MGDDDQEVREGLALLHEIDPNVVVPEPNSPLETYQGIWKTLEESATLRVAAARNKSVLLIQRQVLRYLQNILKAKRLAGEHKRVAKEDELADLRLDVQIANERAKLSLQPKQEALNTTRLDAQVAEQELQIAKQEEAKAELLRKMHVAKRRSREKAESNRRQNTVFEDLHEIVNRHREFLPDGSTMRDQYARSADFAAALQIVEELEQRHGPDVFDKPGVREYLQKINVPVDSLRPRRGS